MNNRRELVFGLLAALASMIIVGGSFAISFAEKKPEISQAIKATFRATGSSTPTEVVLTPLPGEPTLTNSPTVSATTQETISSTPSCSFPSDWMVITVNQGDTLESLAQTYQTSPEALIEANCLIIEKLSPGSQLFVPKLVASLTPTRTSTPRPTTAPCVGHPSGWVIYIIQPGDTLFSLSQSFGVSVSMLQEANCMGNSILIRVGDKLWVPNVPTQTPGVSPSPTPSTTATLAATPTPSKTATDSPVDTPTPTSTNTATSTSTATSTATPTAPPTNTSTSTSTNTPEPTTPVP